MTIALEAQANKVVKSLESYLKGTDSVIAKTEDLRSALKLVHKLLHEIDSLETECNELHNYIDELGEV